MARIRTIKPEFFRSEDTARLTPFARLLFIGLWTIADREGRLLDRPRRISVDVFPYDEDFDIDALLTELDAGGVIRRYEADGQKCIQIANFAKHQRPHPKEPPSTVPPETAYIVGQSRGETFPAVESREETRPSRLGMGSGSGNGSGKGTDSLASDLGATVPGTARPPAAVFPVAAKTAAFCEVRDAYPRRDGEARAAAVFQSVADEHPSGEAGLRDDILAWVTTGGLKRHPYTGEHRFRPTLEKFLAERRWLDAPSAPDDVAPAARGSPRSNPLADLEDLTPPPPRRANGT